MGMWEKFCSSCRRETLEISCQENGSSGSSGEPEATITSNEATILNVHEDRDQKPLQVSVPKQKKIKSPTMDTPAQ